MDKLRRLISQFAAESYFMVRHESSLVDCALFNSIACASIVSSITLIPLDRIAFLMWNHNGY